MSSGRERRKKARFIVGLPGILRCAKGGPPLDDRAMAHEVSLVGFKVETQAELRRDASILFVLQLPGGGCVSGQGLVVWSKREKFAVWAGIKIVKMAWADKRRLSSVLGPERTDERRFLELAARAAFIIVVVAALQRLFERPQVLSAMSQLIPQVVAFLLMGWALFSLLRLR